MSAVYTHVPSVLSLYSRLPPHINVFPSYVSKSPPNTLEEIPTDRRAVSVRHGVLYPFQAQAYLHFSFLFFLFASSCMVSGDAAWSLSYFPHPLAPWSQSFKVMQRVPRKEFASIMHSSPNFWESMLMCSGVVDSKIKL